MLLWLKRNNSNCKWHGNSENNIISIQSCLELQQNTLLGTSLGFIFKYSYNL